jgi:hypothetical protein
VQHDPHALLLVEAQLDEVIAAAERAEMSRVSTAIEPSGAFRGSRRSGRASFFHASSAPVGQVRPGAAVALATASVRPCGTARSMTLSASLQVVRQVARD